MPKTDLNPQHVLPGDRVLLVSTSDPATRLRPGSRGTVEHVDAVGTVHVHWDNGSTLGLCPDADRFELAR